MWSAAAASIFKTQQQSLTKVLIVDDHLVIRTGLESMLAKQAGMSVAAAVGSGAEALRSIAETKVDVVLLDLHMPKMDGLQTLVQIRKLPSPPKVIMLADSEREEDVFRSIHCGADGFLSKGMSEREALAAITTVCAGRRFLPKKCAMLFVTRTMRTSLSARESEVLSFLVKGRTNKEIGVLLNISSHTARNHVNTILSKLQVADRTEAATAALTRGLVNFANV